MKKSIFLIFAAILCATNAWAWCGNSFITVNGTWCTGSNSYVHTGGKFDGKNLGTLTAFKLGGELQVYPKSSKAASLCYKIDGGAEVAISLPKTGEEGNNSKHSGEADVDLSTLPAGNHTIAVWFKHGSDYDSNGGSNYVATFTIAAATPEPDPVYTVVGSDVLLGTAWDLNNADNEMTKQDDGSYVLVKENVDLATTGTYEYKVVKNHDWGWSVPSGSANNTLKLGNEDVDGTYNVTFTLNKELNALTASLELVEAKKVIPECYVAGDESLTGQDWNAKSVLMTYDEATEVYTATLTAVPAGTHNMKVVYGGEWLGFDHLATPAPANVTEGEDKKIQFTLAEAGDVTVTYHATNGIGLTGNFAEPVTYDYYIVGSFNGDNPKKAENGMTLDGTVYKATVTLAVGDNMLKVTDGTWDNTWGYGQLGAAYEEVSDAGAYNNIKITLAAEKEITVIFDATAGKITFDGLTPYVAPLTYTVTVPAGTEKCYIAGSMNGWAFQEMEAVTGETNKFTITIIGAKETDEYKYACQANWDYAEVIEGGGNRTEWSALDEVTAWNAPAEPAKCYLMGNGDWENGVEMEENPDNANEFILLCHHITESFKFKYGDTWTDAVDNVDFPGVGWEDEDGDDLYNITLPEGCYSFYFKKDDQKVYIAECTPTIYDVTLEGMVTSQVPRTMGRGYTSLEDGTNSLQIYNESNAWAYGDYTVTGELNGVTVEGTGTWAVVDGVETLTATLQACGAIYNVTATVASATTITLECYDATYTITDPEYNEVTFTGVADGKEFTILVSYFGGEYYSEGEWGETSILGTEVEFDDSDASEYYLGGTYIDEASNTYEVAIFGAPAVVEPTPDYTRTVSNKQWGTICLPYASASTSGATFYEVSSLVYGEGLWLDQLAAGAQLEAGKPYIFQATAAEIAVTYTGEAKATPVAGKNGLTGTFTDIAAGGLTGNYIIAENKVWVAGATTTLPANRAYISSTVPTTAQAEIPGRRRVLMGENEATGLDQIVAPEGQTIKAIVNGQLVIIRGGEMYNAQGQKL